jgi:hypothetical protein
MANLLHLFKNLWVDVLKGHGFSCAVNATIKASGFSPGRNVVETDL